MTFEEPAINRLAAILNVSPDSNKIERLTPDASTREFFRLPWKNGTAIACVYPHGIDNSLPQLDVTNLFLKCGLPVASIFQTYFDSGIVVHEDFGDRILRDALKDAGNRDEYIESAIRLIARIQAGTGTAFEIGSIASKLKFEEEKLLWELDFFKTHYFESLREIRLDTDLDSKLVLEFTELSREIESLASVLTHRDFHAANLMVFGGELKIIDHQDARIGAASYDLVSLLLDRISEPPDEGFIKRCKEALQKARAELGMPAIDRLDVEFELVTIQRCLKAIGTFSNQAANFDKTNYLEYIKPMFMVVSKACNRLGRFEIIQAMVENEL